MREIQDLTLQVERGLAAIETKFAARREQFTESLQKFVGQSDDAFGIRATLIPLAPLYIERVHENEGTRPPVRRFTATIGKSDPYELTFPIYHVIWRPMLRGTRGTDGDEDSSFTLEVHCNGLIEYDLLVRNIEDRPYRLYPEWLMGMVCNAICAAELFRRTAGAPDVEYGLEFEIRSIGGDVPVGIYGRNLFGRSRDPFQAGSTIFPRYSLGEPNEFQDVAALLDRDFWNAVGYDSKEAIEVDFTTAFEKMGLTPAQ